MAKLTDGIGGGGGRRAQPGDVLHIDAKDTRGNVVKTYVVHRTAREFVYDLCDSYNAELPDFQAAEGKRWFVTAQKTLAFGTTPEQDRLNNKRAMATLRSIDRAEMDRCA